MQTYLAAPDRADYEPFMPTVEQCEFLLGYYELDRITGKRKIRRGVLSRPRGWGKSPFLAAMALTEALAPVVPAGWDADGQPVAKPWVSVRTPLVQVLATSEAQTRNSWTPLLEMARGGSLVDDYPGFEPLETFILLPRGRIEPVTASATSIKGAKPVFAILDQTEEWTRSNGGIRLAETTRINAAKLGGSTVESPNAFTPGNGSVAEESAAYWAAIKEGRARDDGLYYDHREAPADTDPIDRDSLIAGLRVAYGDSSDHPDGCVLHDPPCAPGWSPIDRLMADFWDPSNDPQTLRADFLNQITHATDSWISSPEWTGCADSLKVIADKEPITLGFDGSRKRTRGSTDATALIGCRVSDGHIFEIQVWEQPHNWPRNEDWEVPVSEVNAAVADAFRRFNVVGFYADPARWETWIAQWEATYARRLKVKSTREHPITWSMKGGRATLTVRALEVFRVAVVQREMTHDGSSTLTRHILNARRRESRVGIQIAKEHPDSAKKIDAAVAAVLAWTARMDALAAGIGTSRKTLSIPKRIY